LSAFWRPSVGGALFFNHTWQQSMTFFSRSGIHFVCLLIEDSL
jgi:hypothetical protein